METGSHVYQAGSESRSPAPGAQERVQVRFTPEDLRTLRECNRESFYYRCLPFALIGMALTHVGVRKGFLVAHPRWGASIKMTGAAFLGWVVGKFTYRRRCEDKFINLENSVIGEAVRKKRGISIETFKNEFPTFSSDEDLSLKDDKFSYISSDDYHSSSGSLNLDVDKNIQYSGLDDRERPSTDRDTQNLSEDNETIKKITTYDELRRKNREDYERQQKLGSKPEPAYPSGAQKPWSSFDARPPRRFSSDSSEGSSNSSKNIYGDAWDNPKFN